MAQVQLNMAIMDGFQFFFFWLNHWPIVYIVLHCCFGRYFVLFLVYFCSFTFSLVRVSIHYSTIVVVLTLTHRYNAVRGHRTASNNSGAEKLPQEKKQIKAKDNTHNN